MRKNARFKIISYFCGVMNKQYFIISLKKEVFVSCFLIGLFFLEGGNCYASEQQALRGTIEVPSDHNTVRGRVIDIYGEPLIGATIREKGGANGTVTDIDGKFFFCLCRIVLSYKFLFVGYKTVEVNVAGRNVLEIRLQEDAVMLEHVIVTALGLEKDEATLAYSVQKIKGEELNRVKEVNMIAALAGEKLPVCKSTKTLPVWAVPQSQSPGNPFGIR